MNFVPVPRTTLSEYRAMRARREDFCDGCAGRFSDRVLVRAMLETSDGFQREGKVCPSCRARLSEERRAARWHGRESHRR
jgi:hypothetical protein